MSSANFSVKYADLVLLEFTIVMPLNFLTMFNLITVLVFVRKTGKPLSVFLIALMVNWLTVCVHCLPYFAYSILLTSGIVSSQSASSALILYSVGVCSTAHLPSIQLSTFALMVDRILSLRLPGRYRGDFKRKLFWLSVTVFLTVFAAFAFALFTHSHPKQGCLLFGCMMEKNGARIYQLAKLVFSLANIVAGLIFFFALKTFTKASTKNNANGSLHNRQKASNKLALFTICMEVCLNFVPFCGPILFEMFTGFNPGIIEWGPYALVTSFAEMSIVSRIYRNVIASPHTTVVDASSRTVILAQPLETTKNVY